MFSICAVVLLVVLMSLRVEQTDAQRNRGGQKPQKEEKDFYKVLGLAREATTAEVKRAYRKLSLQYHPDKNKDPEATTKFAAINEAYEVLKDESKRRRYDQYGEEGLKENGRQRGGGGFDPFADFFGFNRGGGRNEMKTGPGIQSPVQVTLEDLYNGKTFTVLHKKQVLCHVCRGTGAENPDDVTTCTACNGQGVKTRRHQIGPGFFQTVQETCHVCNGKGKTITSTCPHCNGHKVEQGSEELILVIERGMPDHHHIVFQEECDESPEQRPGDLTFVLTTLKHPIFTRDNNDLKMEMTITLLEALVGFEKHVVHLDGHAVTVKRAAVTIPGQVIQMPGEGMPHHQFPSEFGDLYITITVQFPKRVSETQAKIFRDLLKA